MIPACNHCMRGLSQNIDISDFDIDSILNQTALIMMLRFTGGEPFLAINKMNYTLDKLIENKIALLGLYIVTNGMIVSDDAINTIKRYSDYIKECRKEYQKEYNDLYFVEIGIEVSTDRFHLQRNEEIIISNYFKLQRELVGIARVVEAKRGNTPYAVGLAKHLPITETKTLGMAKINNMQIAICDKDHIPVCPVNTRLHDLISDDEKIVCCDIVITATGNVVNQYVGDREYYTEDSAENIICKVQSDIWNELISYNVGKMNCIDWNNYRKNTTNSDFDTVYHNYIYDLTHSIFQEK